MIKLILLRSNYARDLYELGSGYRWNLFYRKFISHMWSWCSGLYMKRLHTYSTLLDTQALGDAARSVFVTSAGFLRVLATDGGK